MQRPPHPRPAGPPPRAAPRRKGWSGCLLGAAATLALGTAAAVGIGVYCYVEYSELIGASADMAGILKKAARAPAADAMRAAGCDEAFALEQADVTHVVQRFADDLARREGRAATPLKLDGVGVLLSCVAIAHPMSCADVAKVYVTSQSPTLPFIVRVRNDVDSRTEKFSSAGTLLGPADALLWPNVR